MHNTNTSFLQQFSIGLAPMEGIGDFAFRSWLSLLGKPHFYWSPFLRVTQSYKAKNIPKLFCPEVLQLKQFAYPIIPQLMSSSAEELIPICHSLLDFFPFIDINCACPTRTVVKNGAGSALISDSETFFLFVEKLVTGVGSKKISLKIRTGFHNNSEFTNLIGSLNREYSVNKPSCLSSELALVTVHGRNRVQGYSGKSDWNLISQASNSLHCPTIGSGDITDISSLEYIKKIAPNLNGVIIGRGALANPWIFYELETLDTKPPSLKTLLAAITCYAIFAESLYVNSDTLLDFWLSKINNVSLGKEESSWLNMLEIVCQKFNKAGYNSDENINITISPGALGQVKMLLKYMENKFWKQKLGNILQTNSFADLLTSLKNSFNN